MFRTRVLHRFAAAKRGKYQVVTQNSSAITNLSTPVGHPPASPPSLPFVTQLCRRSYYARRQQGKTNAGWDVILTPACCAALRPPGQLPPLHPIGYVTRGGMSHGAFAHSLLRYGQGEQIKIRLTKWIVVSTRAGRKGGRGWPGIRRYGCMAVCLPSSHA